MLTSSHKYFLVKNLATLSLLSVFSNIADFLSCGKSICFYSMFLAAPKPSFLDQIVT